MFALLATVASFAVPAEVPFSAPRPVDSGRAVQVAYGTTPCSLPIRWAAVRDSRERVVITLVGQPQPPGLVCAQVLQVGCVEIPLEEELEGREIVDGTGRASRLGEGAAERARAGPCPRVPRRPA